MDNGQVEEKHAEMILHEIHEKIASLKLRNPTIKSLDWRDMIKNSELGEIFNEETLDEVLKKSSLKEKLVQSGAKITGIGSKPNTLHLVTRVTVHECSTHPEVGKKDPRS